MGRRKITIKIMREIRKTVPRVDNQDVHGGVETDRSPSSPKRRSKPQLILPVFDATRSFLNTPNLPILLHQCMNALTPPKPNKHKRGKVKTSPPSNIPKRTRSSFLPLTIPGTPEAPVQANPPQPTSSSSSTRCTECTPNDGDTDDDLTYLDLYYQVFDKHRPEPGESNAEAAARHSSLHRGRVSTTEGQI